MTFPLAGLLRVRGAQERVAAEKLSRASAERAQAEAAEQTAISSLADISAQIDDPRALMAMAAARAAGRSTLSDLQALVDMRRGAESEAKSAHVDARRELKGLERLESTHRVESAKAELAAEQTALDEIAVVRTSRREERRMSGLASVIARVDAIESQIVSLDPAARAAAATATASTAEASATSAASAASAATFSGVLEAAKAAASTETTNPVSAASAATDGTSSAKNAELVSALQTLFSANTSGSAGSAASMQKLIEMLG